MQRTLNGLFIVALVGAIFGCASLPLTEGPKIQSVSPRITGLDFQGLDMAFDVAVNNPYPVSIKTPRFRYGMDVEGQRFFDSEATSSIDLPASGIGKTTLPVRLSYADLARTFRGLADASEANYTLDGALLVPVLGNSFELPLSHSGTFPILRPPTFSDINVDLADVSLTGAGVNVDAIMKNPNAFALGIENLGYMLKLGNIELGNLTATTGSTLDAGGTGKVSLSGRTSAASALLNLIKGGGPGVAKILPTGTIQTPYGPVKFQ